jgi:hypothetical protein
MDYLLIRAGECATARDVLVRCIEASANRALLEADALPQAFFDLSSGAAGELVQGLMNYGIRMAAIVPDMAPYSASFQAFARETNRGHHFRFFESRSSAAAWLDTSHA